MNRIMEDKHMRAVGRDVFSCGESNDSGDSLDRCDDIFAAFKGMEFNDMFDACPLLELRSESFNADDWLLDRAGQKYLDSESKIKARANNAPPCNNSLNKDTSYLTERFHWNYGSARVNYDPRPISKRSRKRSIPDEMKDDAYWKKRSQNTERARKSREARRLKEIEVLQKVRTLEEEKLELQQEVRKLQEQLKILNERLFERENNAGTLF